MQVKTFKAIDMPEALRMVKSEFGPDAMILSSKKEKPKGFLGRFSKPYFEVTAALDNAPRVTYEPRPEARTERERPETSTLDEFQKSMLAPMARELKDLRARVETLTAKEREAAARQAVPAPSPAPPRQERQERFERQEFRRPAPEMREPTMPQSQLPQTEVEELKKVLQRSLAKNGLPGRDQAGRPQQRGQDAGGAREVARIMDELRDSGIDDEAISRLMPVVSEAAVRGESAEQMRLRLKKSIEDSVSCSGPFKLKKSASRILAMVGPTGVGKTTTIAKLAALAYKQGVSVALITIDTFRIGAVAQLQTYSGIMNMPMVIASTPAELSKAIAAHADKQLIFIDTAGRSPRDQKKIQDMKAFLEVHPDIETHLCLSATTRDRELSQTVNRFRELPVSRLLFTKLDESMSFGCIVNTHLKNKLPLSYFTTGQKVPEDIETASPKRVADLVVREMKP